VQSDVAEAKQRGIERDGGDERATSFWDHWEAEEAPFFMHDRPWERADAIVAGGQVLPHDRSTEVVVATPPPRE
jgi:hypothetical protein